MAVVDCIRTTLGPRGMDKLIHDEKVSAARRHNHSTIDTVCYVYAMQTARGTRLPALLLMARPFQTCWYFSLRVLLNCSALCGIWRSGICLNLQALRRGLTTTPSAVGLAMSRDGQCSSQL